jgi:tRNA 2-thiouridine synthesizing protein A
VSTVNPDNLTPDITVEGTGLLCVTLLLRLRKEIDGALPGAVVHVVTTDPAALLDLPAWCHMTGHHYLDPVPNAADVPVCALRIAAGARPTRAGAPWHADDPEGWARLTSAAWPCVRDGRSPRSAWRSSP